MHRLSSLLVLCCACSDPAVDVDAGPDFDGGPDFDAGVDAPSFDGGPGFDGGPAFDGGPGFDGGPSSDAGRPPATSSWLGIPEPPFGLNDSHTRYDGADGFTEGDNGPFTILVDNTHPGCSDSGGTEATPRCTIPTAIAAGQVVEVRGGPYALTRQTTAFQIDGTESAPSWLRGVDVTIDAGGGENRHWSFAGTYFIVEGFRFIGGATVRSSGDHYALRHSEIDFGERNCVNAGGSYGVIYDNHIHHCHRQPGGQDTHGVQVGVGSDHTWVLANDIHHNFGNGIQWGHGAEANKPDFVFIAGNFIHQDRETGIASKWSNRSVISENVIWGYRPSPRDVEWCADDGSYCNTPTSGSAGQAIVSGADGEPTDEWVLYNTLSDVQVCLRLEAATRVNYVGNVCHDAIALGLRLEKNGPNSHIVHNTFYGVARDGMQGVLVQDWRDDFENLHVANNILHTSGAPMLWFEDFGSVVPSMRFEHNLLFNDGAAITIDWRRNQNINTSAELESAMAGDTATFVGNQIVDPQLVDVEAGDFRPRATSVAAGAATDVLDTLDSEFQTTFGVSMIRPCWAEARDIGARCAEGR